MMTNCTDLPCLDELFSNVTFLTNLVYVREELEKDPLFLLRPCVDGSPLLAQWTNLINFEPPQRVFGRLEDLGENYWLQTLESTDGGLINMDYFSVNISQLPEKSPGVTMTSEEFLETVRQGWATENFFGLNGKCALGQTSGAEFIYDSPDLQQIWTSEDPTTSIFTIKMVRDGLACLSELSSNVTFMTNLSYVSEQLKKDPLFLIKNCGDDNIDPQDYVHLFNHNLPKSSVDRLDELGSDFYFQDLDNAHSSTINLDHFSVEITEIPDFDNNGSPDNIDDLFQAIRENFLDLASGSKDGFESNCFFGGTSDIWWTFQDYPGFNPPSSSQWLGVDPLSTIFFIDAGGTGLANLVADPGAVIVSDIRECCWIFSTIATPISNRQPFSGHRQFGLRTNENGNLEFFTRAVDRVKLPRFMKALVNDACSYQDYFDIGYETWSNLTDEVKQFIQDENQGAAEVHRRDFVRPNYKEIKEQLKTNIPMSINCN